MVNFAPEGKVLYKFWNYANNKTDLTMIDIYNQISYIVYISPDTYTIILILI